MICASIRDMSQLRQAQEEKALLERRVSQAERMESLGRLVGGVAHDFNNLLNIITGYTEFIGEQVTALAGPDSSMLDDVRQVSEAARRGAELTRQLLAVAGRDVIHPVALDIAEVAAGLEPLLRRTLGEHVELSIKADAGSWPVLADRGQAEVLINLAVNGGHAMPGAEADHLCGQRRGQPAASSLAPRRLPAPAGLMLARQVTARWRSGPSTGVLHDQPPGLERLGLATVHGIVTWAGGYAKTYSELGWNHDQTSCRRHQHGGCCCWTRAHRPPPRGNGQATRWPKMRTACGSWPAGS